MAFPIKVAFILLFLFPIVVFGQRERLVTPSPFREFSLLEKKLISAFERDSLANVYPLADSVAIYDIAFSTIGRNYQGYYITPIIGTALPAILYNLEDDIEQLHFDHSDALQLARNAPRGHAIIIADYYDPANPPHMGASECREVNAVTNLVEHLHFFPEVNPAKVLVREAPLWKD